MPTRDLDHFDRAATDRLEVVDHLLLMSRYDDVVISTLEVRDRNIMMTRARHLLAKRFHGLAGHLPGPCLTFFLWQICEDDGCAAGGLDGEVFTLELSAMFIRLALKQGE